MSIEAELRAETDRWERKENAVHHALPYLLLAVSAVFQVVNPVAPLAPVLGLTVVTALWLLWFHTLHPDSAPGRYYLGLIVLAAALVALSPWFGFFAFIGYLQALHYLTGRRRYVGVVATAVITSVGFLGGLATIREHSLWGLWMAVIVVTSALACASFSTYEMSGHQSEQQKRAVADLHEANVTLATTMAENAGLQAQLMVQAREAGVLDERQRMAREIHDTLAQGLAGILTQLQAAEETLDDREILLRHLTNATNLARESLTEARRSVDAVQPSVLADARLPEALGEVADRWSEVHRIDATLTTTGDARPMHTDIEVALLRAAQEALANVAKHARAGRVGLTLSYMEDLVTLDVRDDGVGFDPLRSPGSLDGGFGLAAMRQRVGRLAGRLEIESEPGGGTAISVAVPALEAGGPA
ncbi:sensor histidine kinase [Cryptosporangium sp. NPDC048952]|uniref:sensor histidine kinase n=1 Tax=Cryptosporangium sp. NPDC048952 TaxID=3363961 RepID=UPI00372321F3